MSEEKKDVVVSTEPVNEDSDFADEEKPLPLIFVRDGKEWSPLGFVFILLGVALSTLVRFMGSAASSMINYGLSFTAALIYNEVYIPVTAAVALVAMEALYIPLAKLNKHFPVAQRG